ncbi:MAG TPA: hypothetical protein VHX42_05385, partial [Candidatus Babeliales bacterium]|nr:hypothetical protein [Candidatus Babeliales bacterium]
KNKKLLLFPLFLLLPVATQCMEQITVVKPKTMQEIREDRNAIYAWRTRKEMKRNSCYCGFDEYFFQNYWTSSLNELTEYSCNDYKNFKKYLKCNHEGDPYEGYSALGIAAMAIKNKKSLKQHYFKNTNSFNNKTNVEISFKEKKTYIKDLMDFGFQLTEKDKEVDMLNAYEQAIATKLFLQRSQFLSKIELPQEIVDHIALIMSQIKLFS